MPKPCETCSRSTKMPELRNEYALKTHLIYT